MFLPATGMRSTGASHCCWGSSSCVLFESLLSSQYCCSVPWGIQTWDGKPHRLSACSEMPVEAASEMIATSFLPFMKDCFSLRLTSLRATCA